MVPKLGFSHTSDFTCGLFRELDALGRHANEEMAQLCAAAPTGPLTGVWMSQHTVLTTSFPGSTPSW